MLKVEMQYVENYADDPSENYWKFKGGSVVGIFGSENRPANVIAALMEKDNGRHSKMIPMSWDFVIDDAPKEEFECDYYLMYNKGNLMDIHKTVSELLTGRATIG